MVREDLRMKWTVVVPSNRPESIALFLKKWESQFVERNVNVIICDDTPDGSLLEDWTLPDYVSVYGRDVWPDVIPRRTDMCRSYGFLKAWEDGAEYILSLDDDVYPRYDRNIFYEYEQVFKHGLPLSQYLNVGALTSFGKPMRGFPFADRDPASVAIQWGGWHGVLDYDAPTQLKGGFDHHESFDATVVPVPRGVPVTGCAMNMAFLASWAPIMWQLPLLDGRYNRWGDIWSGLLAKKVADLHGFACAVNGKASVFHSRASNPEANLVKEQPGMAFNEKIWQNLAVFPGQDIKQTYLRLIGGMASPFIRDDPGYARRLMSSAIKWIGMFDVD